MKSWSSAAWGLAATASDCRCACSAKWRDRVSGTQIRIGRSPWARSRARSSRAFFRKNNRFVPDIVGIILVRFKGNLGQLYDQCQAAVHRAPRQPARSVFTA